MNEIKIIYENENFLIVDKPAGILVHPTAANETNTLVDFLTQRYTDLKKLNWPDPIRAGIVHRLDKDTSGLIILAKNPETLENLQAKFKKREVKKTYQALVVGHAPSEGKINIPIVRDSQKDMMKTQIMTFSFSKGTAREAETLFETVCRYKYKNQELSLVNVRPQTGRMHQIRVHMKHEGFPLLGDQLYFNKPSKRLSKDLCIDRQFLHATHLEFDEFSFDSDLSADLKKILEKLKAIHE